MQTKHLEESKGQSDSGTPGKPETSPGSNQKGGSQQKGSQAGAKRKFNDARQKRSQDQLSSQAKRRKLDSAQKQASSASQQVAIEQMMQQAEKSLRVLRDNRAEFFEKIGSRSFKATQLEKCAKSEILGNRLRSFAQQQSVTLSRVDPRLRMLVEQYQAFQESRKSSGEHMLFKDKRVMDIGCHIGSLTLQIGAHYQPSSVLGIDIDPQMIKASIGNLHKLVNTEEVKKEVLEKIQQSEAGEENMDMLTVIEQERQRQVAQLMQRIGCLPKSFQLLLKGESQVLEAARDQTHPVYERVINTAQLRERVQFRSQNYIEDISETSTSERFDVILCISTIKWIHFNFGDNGVKALFLKVHEQLVPGGLFIFDPQPWKSYAKLGRLTKGKKAVQGACEEGKDIQLRPHLFKQYLKAIGLRLLTTVVETENPAAKPLFIYQKS